MKILGYLIEGKRCNVASGAILGIAMTLVASASHAATDYVVDKTFAVSSADSFAYPAPWISNQGGVTASAGVATITLASSTYGELVQAIPELPLGQTFLLSFQALGTGTVGLFGYGAPDTSLNLCDGLPLTNCQVSKAFSNAGPGFTPFSFTFSTPGSNGAFDYIGTHLTFDVTSGSLSLQGVSITAVPEPETYAMLLAGLSVVGLMGRKRKQRPS